MNNAVNPQSIDALIAKLHGPLVPVLCAFDDQKRLDLDSTCRCISNLIDRGVRLFWTTHGTSHYMSLTDDEIMRLNQAVAGVTRGKAVFIASTAFHWPVERCIEFVRAAAGWGADAVKLQIDWRWWTPTDEQVVEHYSRIAAATVLPLFAYTWGTPAIRPPLLRQILQIPQFIGLKNDTGDYAEHVQYLRVIREAGAQDRFVAMTGGTMASFLHGWHFGARAFASGTGMYAPEKVIAFYEHLQAGHLAEAVNDIQQYEEPLQGAFVPLGHWACFHTALHLQGFFASPRLRFPIRTLSPEQQAHVADLLRSCGLLE